MKRTVLLTYLLVAMSIVTASEAPSCDHPALFRLYVAARPTMSFVIGTAHVGMEGNMVRAHSFVDRVLDGAESIYVEAMGTSSVVSMTWEERTARAKIYRNFVPLEGSTDELRVQLDAVPLLDLFFSVSGGIIKIESTGLGIEGIIGSKYLGNSMLHGLESPEDRLRLSNEFSLSSWVDVFESLEKLAELPERVGRARYLELGVIDAASHGALDQMKILQNMIDSEFPEFTIFRKHFIFDRDRLLGARLLSELQPSRRQIFMIGAAHLISGQIQGMDLRDARSVTLVRECL